jgi:hypothetical protein
VIYVVVALAAFIGVLWTYLLVGQVVQRVRHRRFLRRATAGELARRCAESVRFMGWADRTKGAALLHTGRAWTESDLLAAIEALGDEVTKDGRIGYGSNQFFFYDGGFAEIAETLRDRLGLPQHWEIALGVRVDPRERRRFWKALGRLPLNSPERQEFLKAHATRGG